MNPVAYTSTTRSSGERKRKSRPGSWFTFTIPLYEVNFNPSKSERIISPRTRLGLRPLDLLLNFIRLRTGVRFPSRSGVKRNEGTGKNLISRCAIFVRTQLFGYSHCIFSSASLTQRQGRISLRQRFLDLSKDSIPCRMGEQAS